MAISTARAVLLCMDSKASSLKFMLCKCHPAVPEPCHAEKQDETTGRKEKGWGWTCLFFFPFPSASSLLCTPRTRSIWGCLKCNKEPSIDPNYTRFTHVTYFHLKHNSRQKFPPAEAMVPNHPVWDNSPMAALHTVLSPSLSLLCWFPGTMSDAGSKTSCGSMFP